MADIEVIRRHDGGVKQPVKHLLLENAVTVVNLLFVWMKTPDQRLPRRCRAFRRWHLVAFSIQHEYAYLF